MPLSNYELACILPATLPEEKLKEQIQKVEGFITERKGELTRTDNWGVRKMTYPIRRNFSGVYLFINFKADPSAILAIDQALRLNESVLRFLLLKIEIKPEKKKKKRAGRGSRYRGYPQRRYEGSAPAGAPREDAPKPPEEPQA